MALSAPFVETEVYFHFETDKRTYSKCSLFSLVAIKDKRSLQISVVAPPPFVCFDVVFVENMEKNYPWNIVFCFIIWKRNIPML